MHQRHDAAIFLFLCAASGPALAQCVPVWIASSGGLDGPCEALATLPDGDVVVGGFFATAGGISAPGIARWNGNTFSSMGTGAVTQCGALVTLPNGDVVAGGQISVSGWPPVAGVARWNGATWASVGSGSPIAHALALRPGGDLVAARTFRIWRWDGSSWSVTGEVSLSPPVSYLAGVLAVACLPNGDVVAGGLFDSVSGVPANGVARWNGTSWSAMSTGFSGIVWCLHVLPNGELIAGGSITIAGGPVIGVARWTGSAWTAVGGSFNNTVYSLASLPDGDLVAGGSFTDVGLRLARWNGTAWTPLGGGTSNIVGALTVVPSGELIVGGDFQTAGSLVALRFARYGATCPATAVPVGTGCTGGGGLVELTSTTLPWIGSMCTSRATGIPSNAFALSLYAWSTVSLPLPAILPQGVPGCTLLVPPDIVHLRLPVAGVVTTGTWVPESSVFLGHSLYEQVVPVEVDAFGNIAAVTASNGLTHTFGVF